MRKAIETCFRWLFRYLFSDCGRVFAVQAVWCACTAQAVHPVRAESFSLNLSGELPSADGRRVAVPTAVGKRVDTCGFYPLNSRFPLFLSLAQTRDRRPLRNRGTAVELPVCRGAHCASITLPLRNARYLSTTHTGYSTQAQHKVNCLLGQEKVPWGTTSAHRIKRLLHAIP